jgi:hypothetical protein
MAATPARRPRRTRRRLILLGIFVVLAIWGAFVAVALVHARHDTRAGIDTLEGVQQKLTPGQLLRGEGIPELRAARAEFTRAHDRVRSPFMMPLRIVPVLGRQVESVDTLTGSAAKVVSIGITAVDQARAAVDAGHPVGAARVALVDHVATIADRSWDDLLNVDLGPNHLLGPLADARDRFATRLHDLRHAIGQLQAASHGLAAFLRGPSHYLVLAGNNAEMRVGSGTFLQIGMLTVKNGTLHLDSMGSITDFPVPAGTVPLTGDLAGRWGFLHPNAEWRNLGASPQFPAEAKLATQMWHAATGKTVDGVLALDVVALKDLLKATGPVRLTDGSTIGADQVLSDVMLRQYIGLVGYPDQQGRRDRLSAIARGALGNLNHGVGDRRGRALRRRPRRTAQPGRQQARPVHRHRGQGRRRPGRESDGRRGLGRDREPHRAESHAADGHPAVRRGALPRRRRCRGRPVPGVRRVRGAEIRGVDPGRGGRQDGPPRHGRPRRNQPGGGGLCPDPPRKVTLRGRPFHGSDRTAVTPFRALRAGPRDRLDGAQPSMERRCRAESGVVTPPSRGYVWRRVPRV